ncbi:hypothetical protein DFH06DRAFT_1254817, partial [Mycena polygramma]
MASKSTWLVRKISASAGAVLSLGSLTTLLNYLKSLPRSLLRREASVPLSRDSVCTYVDFSSLWQLLWLAAFLYLFARSVSGLKSPIHRSHMSRAHESI